LLDGEGLQPPSDANTLARMLGRSASLLQARSCGVLIWDRDKNVLTAMRPFSGLDDAAAKTIEFAVANSAMGSSVLQDRPVLVDESMGGHQDVDQLNALKILNAVAVPLALERRDENNDIVEREVMGAFVAFDKYYGRPFDMEDARLLSMMARQVSAVLVTSQLYWIEQDRRKRVQGILESTSVGLMAVSPKGTVTQANPAALRALDASNEPWFGRPFRDLIGNHEICDLVASTLEGAPTTEPKEFELNVHNQEGEIEERTYRIQLDQISSEDKQSLGWVIVFENITDIRAAERMMSAFVDMVSHELRTPLTPIRGFVATLLQAGEGTFDWETQAEFLQIVDTEAERLGVLIDDFLNIARIQNGRTLQFAFNKIKATDIIEHVVRLHRQSSHLKGNHQLVVDVPDPELSFNGDDGKLQQILHNLVGNALKYSPNGGEVRIKATQDGQGVRISIKDQGLGIPPEQLPKMFQQFSRVESPGHHGIKGTGLGLWLTKHMVEGHKGKIWVESDYGHGSDFLIWIPSDPNNYEPNS
jgi:two-component system phosphate regulon sensor histidine kinase PhoR